MKEKYATPSLTVVTVDPVDVITLSAQKSGYGVEHDFTDLFGDFSA